jgi:hypothetical protein
VQAGRRETAKRKKQKENCKNVGTFLFTASVLEKIAEGKTTRYSVSGLICKTI